MASSLPLSQNAVAKAAGVSPSTVSRALANHPGIPPETRERIRQMAERMGYQKNAMVSMLTAQLRSSRLRKTESTLAYITSTPPSQMREGNPIHYEFFLGAKARAEELGYALDLLWCREPSMSAARFNKILLSRGIRGLLLAPRPKPMSHISLDWSKFSVAAIGHMLPAPHVSFSGAWHYTIIHTALRMLKKYGYRKIGFCISPESDKYANFAFSSRYSLYLQSLPPGERVPFPQNPFVQQLPNRGKFERWFAHHRPEALLCIGFHIQCWLEKMGFSIPQDVAIADLCLPDENGTTAGMYEMPRVIASTAVDLVVEQLHHNVFGIPQYPKAVLFEGKWMDGKTLPKITPSSQLGQK
jgi:DNA-binding LacI/PurR family transcriptional regulator